MKRRSILIAVLISCFAISVSMHKSEASDWIGIYARIDKVVFEPNATAPERIQIWGAFAIANKQDRNSYEPAKRGYLYYGLKAGKEDVCRKEWNDLKSIAGTDQVIGFGGRDLLLGRLRKSEDKIAEADVYPVGWGMVKMTDRRSGYPPIHELRSLPRETK